MYPLVHSGMGHTGGIYDGIDRWDRSVTVGQSVGIPCVAIGTVRWGIGV